MGTTRPFLYAAREFIVWREGAAVNWDCSMPDLARATGLTLTVVEGICRKRGWNLLKVDQEHEVQQVLGEMIPTVDAMMRLPVSSPMRHAHCY